MVATTASVNPSTTVTQLLTKSAAYTRLVLGFTPTPPPKREPSPHVAMVSITNGRMWAAWTSGTLTAHRVKSAAHASGNVLRILLILMVTPLRITGRASY